MTTGKTEARTLEVFAVFIHRANVGTHQRPIVVGSADAAASLVNRAKKMREEFIASKGYDFDGEITSTITPFFVEPITQMDWVRTKKGNYVYVTKVDGVRYCGYAFKAKKLPKTIPDGVKILHFDAWDLTDNGGFKKCN